MPHSSPNLPVAPVRAYLSATLPTAIISQVSVAADFSPLLLMRTTQMVAAFAFSDGELLQSYRTLYEGFKKHCNTVQREWDSLDLAFIFCVRPDADQLDQFCSAVETDVYFCRKFVVPMSEPVGAALARLPFLPLAPVSGQSLRPPSAQTFLQQCGVPSTLARYLVVQQARSAEGIVEDSLLGEFGATRRLQAVTAESRAIPEEHRNHPVRLESLTIENFRAYRRPQTFALGADVTVLYGPNGFGKTSFFDAVDFAMTGSIGRMELAQQADFAKIANHLDAEPGSGVVRLTVQVQGTQREVVRTVVDRKSARLDNVETDRKHLLAALTGDSMPADRVENLVSLFRASHLFSQEQQELTKDLQDHSVLSSEIVSRMLAFEDYTNAVKKAAGVIEYLNQRIAAAKEQVGLLGQEIAGLKAELSRLGQADMSTNPAALKTEAEALKARLTACGIKATAETLNGETLRSWRATIESLLGESDSKSKRLKDLIAVVAGLPRLKDELAAAKTQLIQQEATVQETETLRIATDSAVQMLEKRASELTAKRMELETMAGALSWVQEIQPKLKQLDEQLKESEAKLTRDSDAVSAKRSDVEKALVDRKNLERGATQITDKINARRAELDSIHSLQIDLSVWQANRARHMALVQADAVRTRAITEAKDTEHDIRRRLAPVQTEEQRLARVIEEADRNQTTLRALISQLQGHVHSGTCPLCGVEHGSKDNLLQKIRAHVVSDAATAARAGLIEVRQQAVALKEQLTATAQKIHVLMEQAASDSKERDRLAEQTAGFAMSASKFAIALEAAGPTPGEQVQALVAQAQLTLRELESERQAVATAITTAGQAHDQRIQDMSKAQKTWEAQRAVSTVLRDELNRIRTDFRASKVSLDLPPGELAKHREAQALQMDVVKRDAGLTELELNQKRPNAGALRQQVAAAKAHLAAIRTQVGNLQQSVSQIEIRLNETKLPKDSTAASLIDMLDLETRRHAQLLAVRDSASTLELALDASLTAAALTTIHQTLRNREKAVEDHSQQIERFQPWLRYFEQIGQLLAEQQNQAIETFTQAYGPRTSVIQRRLRSVYGFDDVEVHNVKSAIRVRIRRNGEELRPTDYFSQSQRQTLALGLFLTACSSQTWSAFSPILLDDPITHFDDLNTYAFLDLIVGLLESAGERRQFIMSTCDEKLLLLARQKFRHLGDRAKFYQFQAIGTDGPVVSEVGIS